MEKLSNELSAYREQRFRAIEENLRVIRDNIAKAAVKSGRAPEDIRLMAVTKTVEPCFINHCLHQGVDLMGENRVQEYLGKKDELDLDGVEVHLIGHLQTNKVKQIIREVSMIQSVDSVKLATEISKQAVKNNLTMSVLLEVNVGEEASKSGMLYEAVPDLCAEISELPNLKIEGLMAIPPMEAEEAELRGYFSCMNKLFVDMGRQSKDNVNMKILSMGMSADYALAIEEGANLVRVGSSLFGARIY